MLALEPSVIITSGGTGISPTDATPEQTLPLLDRQVPGVMEALRAYGLSKTPMAALTRGYAGTAGTDLRAEPAGLTVRRHGLTGRSWNRSLDTSAASWRASMSTSEVVAATVGNDVLDTETAYAAVWTPQAGAVVTFSGIVRNHDGGRDVRSLGLQRPSDRRQR